MASASGRSIDRTGRGWPADVSKGSDPVIGASVTTVLGWGVGHERFAAGGLACAERVLNVDQVGNVDAGRGAMHEGLSRVCRWLRDSGVP